MTHRASALMVVSMMLLLAGCMSDDGRAPPATVGAMPIAPAQFSAADRQLIVMVRDDRGGTIDTAAAALLARYPLTLVRQGRFASIEMHGFLFEVTGDSRPEEVMEALSRDPAVALVQRQHGYTTYTTPYDDTLLDYQDGLASMDVLATHAVTTGAGVTVALIDTGVDERHPDLAARIAERRDLVGDAMQGGPGERHGTAMAGIIAAEAGNATGIVGVAPGARLLTLRACSQPAERAGRCTSFALAQAIDTAVQLRADVINLSVEGPDDALLERVLRRALERGTIVVAARNDERSFPAALSGVVAVQRADRGGPSAGERLFLRAPGVEVLTTAPGGTYSYVTGSSASAAFVSGVAALLRGIEPGLSPARLIRLLADAERSDGGAISACHAVQSLLVQTGAPEARRAACAPA